MDPVVAVLAGLARLAVPNTPTPTTTVASPANDLFGGTTNLLQWLVLALAGALVVGNVMALVRAPVGGEQGPRPARTRSLMMIALGTIVVIWAAGSLLS